MHNLKCVVTASCFELSSFFFICRISDFQNPPNLEEDMDVAEERARIYKSEKNGDILRIRDLSKVTHFSFSKSDQSWTRQSISNSNNTPTSLSLFCSHPALLDVLRNIYPCSGPNLYWSLTWRGLWCLNQYNLLHRENMLVILSFTCYVLSPGPCSALVSWVLMEQGRPQRLRC